MTIHAAKGLEFPVVFSVGLEENLFPSGLSINSREELEEERRLFYVVITRAKSRLFLTYANSRYRFGQLVNNESSRFLEEMPEKYIDRSYAGGGNVNRSPINSGNGLWGNSGGGNMFDRMQKKSPQAAPQPSGPRPAARPVPNATPSNHVPSPNFAPDDPAIMEPGMEVEHQKFGFGTILTMEGPMNNRIATVNFPKGGGDKKIMLNYARLMIVKK
jgi:DNA helicase-2/ATP-dependent DNA helicase PcrA